MILPRLAVAALQWLERHRDQPVLAGPGIDVSRHQGEIDWPAAWADLNDDLEADDRPWVYIKATEGQDYRDPLFVENVNGAVAAGFRVGAYHFCRLDSGDDAREDAGREIADFVAAIRGLPLTLLPCLDVELGGIRRRDRGYCDAWVREAIARVWEAVDRFPVLYTGYWTARWIWGTKPPPFSVRICPLWQAEYTNGDRPRKAIPGWGPLLWQHTSKGRVAGICGPVDRNVALGSFALERLHWERLVA